MRAERKLMLEQTGYTIIEGQYDPKYNTSTFLVKPGDSLSNALADYDSFDQIPVLSDGTEISVDYGAYPLDDRTGISTADGNANVALHTWEEARFDAQGNPLVGAAVIIGLIRVITIVVGAVIVMYYLAQILGPHPPPCGGGYEREIDSCLKIVVLPNCDARPYNSCTQTWEGDWHTYTSDTQWYTYLIIGVIIIAGIWLISSSGVFKGSGGGRSDGGGGTNVFMGSPS